jgi:hypothetical protein
MNSFRKIGKGKAVLLLWNKLTCIDTSFLNTNGSLKVKNAIVMAMFYVTMYIICNIVIFRYK